MSRYRVRGMGREFVVIADSEIGAVKKLRDSRALRDRVGAIRIYQLDGNWVKWECGNGATQYMGEAKVFPESSSYGIRHGRVSKFSAQLNGKVIANYDRGWDIVPSAEIKSDVDTIIEYLDSYAKLMTIKDSKALKDAVHTTDIDYVSADAAKKALEVLKRAGYDAMLKTPTKVIVNTDKDISDFIFNKTDGVFICSNEG